MDKLYAGLKDLAGERRAKLDEALRLFQLSREVDDLEQWITERELVASSQELGQDYDHVTVSLLKKIRYLSIIFNVTTNSFSPVIRFQSHNFSTFALVWI